MIYLFDRSDHRHRFGVVQVRHEAPHGDLGLPQSVVQAVDRPQDVPGGPEHVGSVQRRGRLGGVARLAQQPQESRDEEERKVAAAQQQGPPEAEPGVGRPPPQQTEGVGTGVERRVEQGGDAESFGVQKSDGVGDSRVVRRQLQEVECPHEHGQRDGKRVVSSGAVAGVQYTCFCVHQVDDQRFPERRTLEHRLDGPQESVHSVGSGRVESRRQGGHSRW
jgi:hypothetical protein